MLSNVESALLNASLGLVYSATEHEELVRSRTFDCA